MTCYFIGLFSIKTADSAQPRNHSMVPRERVGSGHNTIYSSRLTVSSPSRSDATSSPPSGTAGWLRHPELPATHTSNSLHDVEHYYNQYVQYYKALQWRGRTFGKPPHLRDLKICWINTQLKKKNLRQCALHQAVYTANEVIVLAQQISAHLVVSGLVPRLPIQLLSPMSLDLCNIPKCFSDISKRGN